jgi:ATP-dependent Clp protease ATP-binding subunit ClpA
MSIHIPFQFWCARLELATGESVLTPLAIPEVCRLGSSASELAREFFSALEEKHVLQGHFLETLKHLSPPSVETRRLTLPFSGGKALELPAETRLSFDAFVAQLPNGAFRAFVPVLAVETVSTSLEEIEGDLESAIRLEFTRKKRVKSAHAVLETQWFASVQPESAKGGLEYLTPAEREERLQRGKTGLLESAASRLREDGSPVVGLQDPLDQVLRALQGRFAQSVLVVGPSGCGKSALVEEFGRARRKHKDLASRAVWETTASRLLEALSGDAGWQKNLATLCRDLREEEGILYVRNLSDLFEVGQYVGNETSIAEALRPSLERGEITLLTECTPEQAARLEVRAPSMLETFRRVRIEEPQEPLLSKIVLARAEAAGSEHGVRVAPASVEEALRLQRRFMPYSGFPGRTVRFLESLILLRKKEEKGAVTREDVIRRFCEESGMPEHLVDPSVPFPLADLEKHFRSNLFGQDEAVGLLVDILASVMTGLARPGKPIASLLFTGPTGVGKTEAARLLAEAVFTDRGRMARFDMSEFADPAAVLRLAGDAAGRGEGLLAGAVRREPFSVLLLDEIEKAHPSVFDLLLQVLGEGRLTDGRGRLTDFCSTLVVMTSNLGAQEAPKGPAGFAPEGDRRGFAEHFLRAAESHFRPEFYNRIDRVVPFSPLDRATVRRIVDREIAMVLARPGLSRRNLGIEIDAAAREVLGEKGYDPRYGARYLQRAIREGLVIPLSRELNRFRGSSGVAATVGAEGARLRIEVRGVEGGRAAREDGVPLPEFLDRASGRRRILDAADQGEMLAGLRSALAILERRLRQEGKGFWTDAADARRLPAIRKLLEEWRERIGEIRGLEEDARLLQFENSPVVPPAFDHRLERHARAADSLLLRVLDEACPEMRKAVVGVYGPARRLEDIAGIFRAAAARVGFDARAQRVGTNAEGEWVAWKVGRDLPETSVRTLGEEIEARGPAAALLFGQEIGVFSWKEKGAARALYRVLQGQGGLESYSATRPPPDGVLPAAFGREPVRKEFREETWEGDREEFVLDLCKGYQSRWRAAVTE